MIQLLAVQKLSVVFSGVIIGLFIGLLLFKLVLIPRCEKELKEFLLKIFHNLCMFTVVVSVVQCIIGLWLITHGR